MVGAGLDPNNMDGTYSTNRTGTNCWFPHNHDPIFARVGERIAQEGVLFFCPGSLKKHNECRRFLVPGPSLSSKTQ